MQSSGRIVTRCIRSLLVPALILALVTSAAAQGNPTGTISGRVVDPSGLAIPGVVVTVASPALQGTRTATTSTNGDYIIPFLPAGDYTVTFELQGFQTLKRTTALTMAETLPLDVGLTMATVAESVTVSGQSRTS
jgi:Carboxypeptidase regulatory-like domain